MREIEKGILERTSWRTRFGRQYGLVVQDCVVVVVMMMTMMMISKYNHLKRNS